MIHFGAKNFATISVNTEAFHDLSWESKPSGPCFEMAMDECLLSSPKSQKTASEPDLKVSPKKNETQQLDQDVGISFFDLVFTFIKVDLLAMSFFTLNTEALAKVNYRQSLDCVIASRLRILELLQQDKMSLLAEKCTDILSLLNNPKLEPEVLRFSLNFLILASSISTEIQSFILTELKNVPIDSLFKHQVYIFGQETSWLGLFLTLSLTFNVLIDNASHELGLKKIYANEFGALDGFLDIRAPDGYFEILVKSCGCLLGGPFRIFALVILNHVLGRLTLMIFGKIEPIHDKCFPKHLKIGAEACRILKSEEKTFNIEGLEVSFESEQVFFKLDGSSIKHLVADSLGEDGDASINTILPEGLSCNRFIAHLIKSLEYSSPQIRAGSIRALTRILESGDDLVLRPNLNLAILSKVDDSPQVIDSLLEYIWQFFPRIPCSGNQFFDCLLTLPSHSSPALLKKYINLLEDLLGRHFDHPVYRSNFQALLMNLLGEKIEDKLKSLAVKRLLTFWETKYFSSVESLAGADLRNNIQLVSQFSENLLGLVNSEFLNYETFGSFFEQIPSDYINGNFPAVLECISQVFFRKMLEALKLDADQDLFSKLDLFMFSLASCFPAILANQIKLIIHLLNFNEAKIVCFSLRLLKLYLAKFKPFRSIKYSEVVSRLSSLVLCGSETVIKLSIECLFMLTTPEKENSVLSHLYAALCDNLDKRSSSPDGSVCRSIYAMSILAISNRNNLIHDKGLISINQCTLRILQLLEIDSQEVRNFCCLSGAEFFEAVPENSLIYPLNRIIEYGLGKGDDLSRLRMIKSFDKVIDPRKTSQDAFSAASIIDRYLDLLLEQVLCPSPSIVEASTKLYFNIVKLYLTNPQNVFPSIFCAWQCPWSHLRPSLYTICSDLFTHHSAKVIACISLILQKTFEFHTKIVQPARGYLKDLPVGSQSVLSPLYGLIRGKTNVTLLFKAILSFFSAVGTGNAMLCFLAESLSELYLKNQADFLILINLLDAQICIADSNEKSEESFGLMVLKRLRAFLVGRNSDKNVSPHNDHVYFNVRDDVK